MLPDPDPDRNVVHWARFAKQVAEDTTHSFRTFGFYDLTAISKADQARVDKLFREFVNKVNEIGRRSRPPYDVARLMYLQTVYL